MAMFTRSTSLQADAEPSSPDNSPDKGVGITKEGKSYSPMKKTGREKKKQTNPVSLDSFENSASVPIQANDTGSEEQVLNSPEFRNHTVFGEIGCINEDIHFYDALILHSNSDHDLQKVLKLKADLERLKLKVYLCDQFHPGKGIFQNLQDALDRCSFVLVLLTKDFIRDKWCEKRVQTGVIASLEDPEKQDFVIPIIDGVDERQIPLELKSISHIACNSLHYLPALKAAVTPKLRLSREAKYEKKRREEMFLLEEQQMEEEIERLRQEIERKKRIEKQKQRLKELQSLKHPDHIQTPAKAIPETTHGDTQRQTSNRDKECKIKERDDQKSEQQRTKTKLLQEANLKNNRGNDHDSPKMQSRSSRKGSGAQNGQHNSPTSECDALGSQARGCTAKSGAIPKQTSKKYVARVEPQVANASKGDMPVVKTNDKAKLNSTQRGETDVRQRDAKLPDKYGGNVDSFERKVANEGSVCVNEMLSRSEKRERVQQFSNLKLQDNSEVKSNENETKYTEGFEVDKHFSTKDGGREVAFQNDASTSSGKLKDLPRASQEGKSQEPAPRGASPESNDKAKLNSNQRGKTDVRQMDAKRHDKYDGNVDSFERKVAIKEGSVRVDEKLSRSEKRERVQKFSNLKLQDNSEVKSNKNETNYTEEFDKRISTKDGGREAAFQNDASTSSGKLKDLPRASQQGKSQEPTPRGSSPDSNGKEKATLSVPDQRESNESVHAGNTEQRDRKTEKKEHTHDKRNQPEICDQDDTERENISPQTFDDTEGTGNNKTSKTDITSEEKRIKENVEMDRHMLSSDQANNTKMLGMLGKIMTESFLNAMKKASEPHRLSPDIITGQFGKQSQDLLSLMSIIAAGRTEMMHKSISEAPDSHKPTDRSSGASPKRDQGATSHDTTFDILSTKDKRDSSHERQRRDGATVEGPEKEAIFGDTKEKQKATKLLQELLQMVNPRSSQALGGLAPKASSHGDVSEPEGAPSEKVRSCENTISPSTEKAKTDDHDIQKTTLPGGGNDGHNHGNDKRRNENKPDEDTPKGYFQLPNQDQGQIGKENDQRPIIQHFHFHGRNIQVGNHNLVKHVKKIYNESDQHGETETDQKIDLEEDDEEMVQSTQLDEEVILSDVEDCESGNEQNILEAASQTQTAMDAKTSVLQAKDSTSLMKSKGEVKSETDDMKILKHQCSVDDIEDGYRVPSQSGGYPKLQECDKEIDKTGTLSLGKEI